LCVFWFSVCLFDGFIIAVKKASDHQQCKALLMLNQHPGT